MKDILATFVKQSDSMQSMGDWDGIGIGPGTGTWVGKAWGEPLELFRELWGEPSWNPLGCFVVVLGSLFAGGPRGVFGEARGTFFGRTLGTMETVL